MYKALGLMLSIVKEMKHRTKSLKNFEAGIVAYAYKPSTQKALARELQSHLGLNTKNPFPKTKRGGTLLSLVSAEGSPEKKSWN